VKVDTSVEVSPAMAAGLETRHWWMPDIVVRIEARDAQASAIAS
jgi:hypothetical protein